MTHLIQPNRWSCLPTSFAMLLGIDVATIMTEIGHDGSDILFPDLTGFESRRGFHPQELVDVCWRRGLAAVEFQPNPILTHDDDCAIHSHNITFPVGNEIRILNLLTWHNAVLAGRTKNGAHHAVAWDNCQGKILNPVGTVQELSDFYVSSLWIVCAIQS